MKYQLTFALVASLTGTAFAEFKAPLPEFKNEKQLAEWRAEKASGATSQGYKAEESAFYTGKPYLASSGDYAFKYRTYNPEVARWTSEDPSGFPDGPNANTYAPTPTSSLDFSGLWKIQVTANNPDGFNTGFVNTGSASKDDSINSKATIGYNNNKVNDPNTSIYLTGTASGKITGYRNWSASAAANFKVSVDGSGQLTISFTDGSWDAPDNDLQVASTYAVTTGAHVATLSFSAASIYKGTGLSGAGVAGASLAWTSGTGKVSSATSWEFKAVE